MTCSLTLSSSVTVSVLLRCVCSRFVGCVSVSSVAGGVQLGSALCGAPYGTLPDGAGIVAADRTMGAVFRVWWAAELVVTGSLIAGA